MIEKAPKLKVIHKSGIGVDKIDLKTSRTKGIKVYITAGVNAVPVSEMALMLIMAVLRRLVYADINLRKGKWVHTEIVGTAQYLSGETVGLIGMGNIGKNLTRMLKGFDCKILYYDVCRLTSRGGLVDEKALINALQQGMIAGAGLDVFATEPIDPNSPLLTISNVVLSPHVAGSTLNNMPDRTKHIARNLNAFITGSEISKADIIVG